MLGGLPLVALAMAGFQAPSGPPAAAAWRLERDDASCRAVSDQPDGTRLEIGTSPHSPAIWLTLANPDWRWVRDGRRHPLVVHFGGTSHEVHGLGRRIGGRLELGFGLPDREPLHALGRGGSIRLVGAHGEAVYALADPERIVAELRSCAAGLAASASPANLASYLNSNDYPAAALRNDESGTVEFRLFIGPDGRPGDCAILHSSGSAALDEATCRIMLERVRFSPARDSHGNPVPDTHDARITWTLRD